MDHLLQKVSGANRISILDGFSGYIQIMVSQADQDKNYFITPSGAFMYANMSFGLINIGATFQRALDLEFVGNTSGFTVIYLDDFIFFSEYDENHLKHLNKVFDRCIKYGISINPKNSLFPINEGKLMGNIISKEGFIIDPKRVLAIQTLSFPRNTEIQAFLGKINFLKRFISNYAEIVKDITDMLKKNNEVKWTVSARYAFG